jgi:hypothetical protein
VAVQVYVFLISALNGDEWSASCPGRFIPDTHLLGDSVGPRVGLDALTKKNISCPCWESNPSRPARRSVTIVTELPQLTTLCLVERKRCYTGTHWTHILYWQKCSCIVACAIVSSVFCSVLIWKRLSNTDVSTVGNLPRFACDVQNSILILFYYNTMQAAGSRQQ